ncbi:MAG: hypothetical protein M3Y59_25485 [Myxococcota bacterium]|nr:hypothetical protein [Myxococcota bacterium]
MRLGDLPCLGPDLPVLSSRAVEALRDLLEPAGELLEIHPPPGVKGRFHVFNVTRVIDAFDRAKCDADWVEGGGMWDFRRLAFRPQAIAGIPIFRTQGLVGTLMVQTPFVERVTQAGLLGFRFIPHWPEPGPEIFPNPPVPKRKRSS